MVATPPVELAAAREQFMGLVDAIRPDLHRYLSRLVGSAIDGEDLVQDTLAKGFYALSQSSELPPLRPWLFRIARNTAIDFMRRYDRRHVESRSEIDPLDNDDIERDPAALKVSVAAFMALPASQRSAVILKDVLDESLADIAEHLGTTALAVKALLVRGRAALAKAAPSEPVARNAANESPEHRALVDRYVALFNARDWTGVQSLLIEECRLDLVAKSQRQGKAVGMYFGRYAQETDVLLRPGRCGDTHVLGVFRGAATAPAYVIVLESENGKISFIRDYRYVPYMADDLEFVPE